MTCADSKPTIRNCTIVNNTATSRGGGVWLYLYSRPRIFNSIVRGNTPEQIYREGTGDDTRGYFCNIEGGWLGKNVIDADPLFVDADGPDDIPATWGDNNYRLLPGSPCIDAGCNWEVMSDLADLDGDGDVLEYSPLDLEGEGRFFDDPEAQDSGCGATAIVDMGAYEYGESGPQPCRGDVNGDGQVNLSDLAELLAHYGEVDTCSGDLECDRDVGLEDLAIMLSVYGNTCD